MRLLHVKVKTRVKVKVKSIVPAARAGGHQGNPSLQSQGPVQVSPRTPLPGTPPDPPEGPLRGNSHRG
jgi:hypothetical protein